MSEKNSTYNRTVPWAVGAAFLIFAVWGGCSVFGQKTEFDAKADAGVEVWAGADRFYQNAFNLGGDASIKRGGWALNAYASVRWWGANDGKVPGAPTNAEAGKVLSRTRGGYVTYRWRDVAVGVQIHRNMVHHFWRNKNSWRHDDFPHDNSWRGAVRRCEKEEEAEKVKPHAEGTCPSIGYWDAYGPRLAYHPDWGTISATAPIVQWKDLTLPPANLMTEATIRPSNNWRIVAHAEADREWYITGRAGAERRLYGSIWAQVIVAHEGPPDWREALQYAALGIVIR
jgi:hypothetical protein